MLELEYILVFSRSIHMVKKIHISLHEVCVCVNTNSSSYSDRNSVSTTKTLFYRTFLRYGTRTFFCCLPKYCYTRACLLVFLYYVSLSLNNSGVCDMLTHVRVNLSLMLSVTTDSCCVKIVPHTRAIGTEE